MTQEKAPLPIPERLIRTIAKAIYSGRNGKWDYKAWSSDPRIAEAYFKDAQVALSAIPLMDMVAALEELERVAGLPSMQDDPARAKARAVLEKWAKLEQGE